MSRVESAGFGIRGIYNLILEALDEESEVLDPEERRLLGIALTATERASHSLAIRASAEGWPE